ncbi:universal stress protein [Natrialba swarupiae]|uniref:Universal stress protein n=1 Tax=Natrialba swarupiae TaxID=2448032 RepID=A0A5D5AS41_9EURY|nr:universal stress protein [Natrialba swarupiae]MCW8173496.1 universal stress protein [Natrialba swarupiae]TYT62642.1 universal stress protein [Natrialba swarupiae]
MVVLAAVDRSNQAHGVVEEARYLADLTNEELHVIHVLSRKEFVDLERTSVDETGGPASIDQVRQTAESIADEIASETESEYVPVGEFGNVASEISQYANNNEVSYVVIGGRKRTPVGKAVFGSVTQSVLLETKVPVVTLMNSAQ